MTQDSFIEEVVSAIGSRIAVSDEKKRDFALHIRHDLYFALADAKSRESHAFLYANVTKSACNLENALKEFWASIHAARQTLKSINPLSGFLGDDFTNNCNTKHLLKYFKEYNTQITKIKPKTKKGPQNLTSDAVAETIAQLYIQYFGSISTGKWDDVGTGSDAKLKSTPYDRVCAIVEKYYKIELTPHALRKAVTQTRGRVKKSEK